MRPKIISLIDGRIINASVTLPSGKQLVFNSKVRRYETSDPEEVEFFSKLKGFFVRDIGDKEYIRHLERMYEEIPDITNRELTVEAAEKSKWYTEDENKLIEKLRELGYIVYKAPEKKPTQKKKLPLKPGGKNDKK